MSAKLNPYLNFRGQAAQALAFYESVFGGSLTTTTFREGGMPMPDGADLDQVMHGQLEIDEHLTLMAADAPAHMPGEVHNGSIALFGDDAALLRRWWDGLDDGATVTAPLERAPWGDTFGMLTDRYGVSWLVNITGS